MPISGFICLGLVFCFLASVSSVYFLKVWWLVCSQGVPDGVEDWDAMTFKVERSGVNVLWNLQEVWTVWKGGCSWSPVSDLGTNLRDWILGNKES